MSCNLRWRRWRHLASPAHVDPSYWVELRTKRGSGRAPQKKKESKKGEKKVVVVWFGKDLEHQKVGFVCANGGISITLWCKKENGSDLGGWGDYENGSSILRFQRDFGFYSFVCSCKVHRVPPVSVHIVDDWFRFRPEFEFQETMYIFYVQLDSVLLLLLTAGFSNKSLDVLNNKSGEYSPWSRINTALWT